MRSVEALECQKQKLVFISDQRLGNQNANRNVKGKDQSQEISEQEKSSSRNFPKVHVLLWQRTCFV